MSGEGRPVKTIGTAELRCAECPFVKGSTCEHAFFKARKLKPLILAEEGTTEPVFCPLVREEQDDPR